MTQHEVQKVLEEADLLHSHEALEAAFDRMARAITDRLCHRDPVVLAVMIGGLFPTARLVCRLDFPLQVDYVHATRYRGEVHGSELHWRVRPATSLKNRSVLVVDDILDQGLTLAAILDYCKREAAREVYSAVMVDKQHGRKRVLKQADFTGLRVDDRYVFGCGMDYRGYLRHVSGIYAVKGL